jgi:hypothetical protein
MPGVYGYGCVEGIRQCWGHVGVPGVGREEICKPLRPTLCNVVICNRLDLDFEVFLGHTVYESAERLDLPCERRTASSGASTQGHCLQSAATSELWC